MPTSYTEMLEDNPNLSTEKWILEGIVRNSASCISLHDYDPDMTADEVQDFLEKEVKKSTLFYRKELSKIRKMLKAIENNPEETWNKLYSTMADSVEEANIQIAEKSASLKERFRGVREDLMKLLANTESEPTKNVARYGLRQLELEKSETEPYVVSILTLEEYKASELASLRRDMGHYIRKINETTKREKKRASEYKEIRSEVERVLGSSSKEEADGSDQE